MSVVDVGVGVVDGSGGCAGDGVFMIEVYVLWATR